MNILLKYITKRSTNKALKTLIYGAVIGIFIRPGERSEKYVSSINKRAKLASSDSYLYFPKWLSKYIWTNDTIAEIQATYGVDKSNTYELLKVVYLGVLAEMLFDTLPESVRDRIILAKEEDAYIEKIEEILSEIKEIVFNLDIADRSVFL